MSAALWVAAVLLGCLLLGVMIQTLGLALDRVLYPAPGRLLGRPGRRLHVYEQGSGAPTIVLESGIAASSLNWRALQRDLSRFARVISYDRAGFGWSDAAAFPRTLSNVTEELEILLDEVAPAGPLLFVAHSFGSLIVREFARRHPARIAGIVLLDPIDCRHWRNLSPQEERRLDLGIRFAKRGAWLARLGVVRAALLLVVAGARALPKGIARATSGPGAAVVSRITEEVGKMPREVWPAVRAHWSRPESFTTMAAYLSQLRHCVREVPGGALGQIPLVVISAEKASETERQEHRSVAALSSRGEHLIAEGSGHWVHLDRPDVVIAAVRRLLGD